MNFTLARPGRAEAAGSGRRTRAKRLGIAAAAATSACAVAVTTALALDEVGANRAIEVDPHSNFVGLSGYPGSTDLEVVVRRDGVAIGSTIQTTTPAGELEINHLGDTDCWDAPSTPDIRGGDEVSVNVVGADPVDTDSANVRDIQLDSAETVGDTIVLSGHAQSHPAAALGTGTVTASIRMDGVSPRFQADEEITTDGPFTVVFDAGDGVTPAIAEQWDDAPERAELTWANGNESILTLASVGGDPPVAPNCPPLGLSEITERSHPAVNLANVGTDMTVGGVAAPGVTSVEIAINGGAPVDTVAPAGDGTWQATVPAALLGALAEGEFELSAAFDGANEVTRTILKDTIAPDRPTATPPAGTYPGSQQVTLSSTEPFVRWTNNGVDPTTTSGFQFDSPIAVTATQTIKAIAVDPAGNPSTVAPFDYVIQPPATNGGGGGDSTNNAGAGPGAGGGAGGGATPPPPAQQNAPAGAGNDVVADPLIAFRVRSLRAPGRLSLRTARRRGVTARFLVPEGTQLVRASLFLHTPRGTRSRRLVKRVTFAVDGSGRYAARFSDRRTRRKLRKGVYTISVAPGTDAASFAEGTAKRFRIR